MKITKKTKDLIKVVSGLMSIITAIFAFLSWPVIVALLAIAALATRIPRVGDWIDDFVDRLLNPNTCRICIFGLYRSGKTAFKRSFLGLPNEDRTLKTLDFGVSSEEGWRLSQNLHREDEIYILIII